jgi:hypothetical protein
MNPAESNGKVALGSFKELVEIAVHLRVEDELQETSSQVGESIPVASDSGHSVTCTCKRGACCEVRAPD